MTSDYPATLFHCSNNLFFVSQSDVKAHQNKQKELPRSFEGRRVRRTNAGSSSRQSKHGAYALTNNVTQSSLEHSTSITAPLKRLVICMHGVLSMSSAQV
jgi:hypothetical protein